MLENGQAQLYAHPGALITTFRSISNSGLITGLADTDGKTLLGFIFNPTTNVYIDLFPQNPYTIVGGINFAGQVVGTTRDDANRITSFLRQPDGTIVTIGTNGSLRPRAINDNGLIGGFDRAATSIFVGTSAGFQTFSLPTSLTGPIHVDNFYFGVVLQGINNAGQIVGFFENYDGAGSNYRAVGYIGSPATLPIGTSADGAFTFNTTVIPNVPIFIDPAVATGYDYAIGAGDPFFATVALPIGIGDNLYTITVGGQSFVVAGGAQFDFRSHGFADGVSAFKVTGIETGAALDPLSPDAFVTELTFVAAGSFTCTQRAITTFVTTVPEPSSSSLLVLAGGAMLGLARRGGRLRRSDGWSPSTNPV